MSSTFDCHTWSFLLCLFCFCLTGSLCETFLPDDFCQDISNVNCDENEGCRDCDVESEYCRQCEQPLFFKMSNQINGNDNCLDCKANIPNCLQCADTQGCQQCKDNVQPVENSCGVKVCPLEGSPPEPTRAPTTSPSMSPTGAPSAMPTKMPLTLEEEFSQRAEDFIKNGFDLDLYDPDGTFCYGDFGCGGLDFLDTFGGICDKGANTFIELLGELPTVEGLFLIFKLTTCCESSHLEDSFFIHTLTYLEIDVQTGKRVKLVSMYLDGTDLVSLAAVREFEHNV